MASKSPLEDDELLQKIKSSKRPLEDESKIQLERDDNHSRRVHEQYEKGRARVNELVDDSTTLPATISSVTVLNALNTRRSFLARIFNPLLSINQEQPYTLAEAIEKVVGRANLLERLDIFHQPISIYFDKPSQSDPSSTPTDLAVFLSVREKSRLVFSSGTWAGTNDGSVYGNLLLRNLFGGAESLNANVSYGTRTRSAYSVGFDSPILSNPDLRIELGGLQSATDKSWASHEERLRGGFTRLKYLTPGGHHRHEFSYNGFWRQVTSLAGNASPTVRADAGDSFKSSLSHVWTFDRRDNPLLPTRGFLLKTTSEVAGLGPLKGDVSFGKFETETSAAVPIPIPYLTDPGADSGMTLSASLRGGLLYPFGGQQSRISDRFTLGGPSDVRGFRYAGLGPRDGASNDAVGGDIYAAGGLSLLFPMPRVSKDKPLRLQAFINGGRLLAVQGANSPSSPSFSASSASDDSNGESTVNIRSQSQRTGSGGDASISDTLAQLTDGLPSIAAGVGVVYALPVARFEVNFSLPLVLRKGEEARKGLGVGVGISFL